jgi:hypothetical protein
LAGRPEAVTVVAEIPSAREAMMTKVEDLDRLDAGPQTDLEYDLAHEWTAIPRAAEVTHLKPSVYVATETVDESGDYGYDTAHDVPGR